MVLVCCLLYSGRVGFVLTCSVRASYSCDVINRAWPLLSIVHEQSCPSEQTACLYKMKQFHFCRSLTFIDDGNTMILVFY